MLLDQLTISNAFYALAAIAFVRALTLLPGLLRTRKNAKIFQEVLNVARKKGQPIEYVLWQLLAEHDNNQPLTLDAVKRWAQTQNEPGRCQRHGLGSGESGEG